MYCVHYFTVNSIAHLYVNYVLILEHVHRRQACILSRSAVFLSFFVDLPQLFVHATESKSLRFPWTVLTRVIFRWGPIEARAREWSGISVEKIGMHLFLRGHGEGPSLFLSYWLADSPSVSVIVCLSAQCLSISISPTVHVRAWWWVDVHACACVSLSFSVSLILSLVPFPRLTQFIQTHHPSVVDFSLFQLDLRVPDQWGCRRCFGSSLGALTTWHPAAKVSEQAWVKLDNLFILLKLGLDLGSKSKFPSKRTTPVVCSSGFMF